MPITPRLKVCAYIRISTDHREQLNSLENQTQRLISSNPAYLYCGLFSDTGISGAKENRPGFYLNGISGCKIAQRKPGILIRCHMY
ncbi:MAG TPA: hypothetical protein DCW46_06710 [Desulfotomaculum sp.]|nr:hypothetical protein [Desulfotomaculum sp.]